MNAKTSSESAFSTEQLPLSIILERRQLRHGRWPTIDWRVTGVAAGQKFAGNGPTCTPVRSDSHSRQYLWSGFHLTLYRDSAESYWHNLVGRQPSLFVICAQRGEHEMAPRLVTADYGEAAAFMETSTRVFATPLPPEVYRWLEDYVLHNYEPKAPEKRQRRKWAEESERGPR